MTIMAGVLCLFSLVMLFGNRYQWGLVAQEYSQVLIGGLSLFAVALLFALSAYGLATKRWWATPLSLILTATVLSQLVFDRSLMRSPVGPIFWLMTLAFPFAMYLEFCQVVAWRLTRRGPVR